MKRERQWDMFDVAVGACELDDYLNQRYQESDLQSKFWVETNDRVDELRPPTPGTKEQVLIPIQGPGVTPPAPPSSPLPAEQLPSRPPWEAQDAPAALPTRPPWEAPTATPAPPVPNVPQSFPPPTPQGPQPAVHPREVPEIPQQLQSPAVRSIPEPEQIPDPIPTPTPEPPTAPMPPNMAELLARFHQAAKDYEERSKDQIEESEVAPTESETDSA